MLKSYRISSYLGGEKLKLSEKTTRPVRAILVSLLFFSISIPLVYAQTEPALQIEPAEQDSEAAEAALPPVNPYREAERGILFEDDGAAGGPAGRQPGSIWSIVRMLLVLIFAAAAIYGVVFFIKRAGKRGEVADPFLKVLASAQLGVGRSAHVLSLGSQAWVVGAAENGVHLISIVEDKDVLNAMLLEDSKKDANDKPGALSSFGDMLRRWGMQVQASAPGPESIRKRRERLKGMQQ